MLKRFLSALMALLLLVPAQSALSESAPLLFRFQLHDKYKTLAWGSQPDREMTELPQSFSECELPQWSDPNESIAHITGFHASAVVYDMMYYLFPVDAVELYYAATYDENGKANDAEQSQLYMVRMAAYAGHLKKSQFEGFLNSMNEIHGNYKKTETKSRKYVSYRSGSERYSGPTTIYHRIYTWSGDDNTGLRLMVDYATHNKSYDNLSIWLGKTKLDSAFQKASYASKEEALAYAPNSIEVTVEKRIVLRDENRETVKQLKVGEHLLIIGYNGELRMYQAILLHPDAAPSAADGFDGYVGGDHLSVPLKELWERFQ